MAGPGLGQLPAGNGLRPGTQPGGGGRASAARRARRKKNAPEESKDSSEAEDGDEAEDRASEIAAAIRSADTWDPDLCAELREMAGLEDEWEAADGESFESILFRAAELLGVEIL